MTSRESNLEDTLHANAALGLLVEAHRAQLNTGEPSQAILEMLEDSLEIQVQQLRVSTDYFITHLSYPEDGAQEAAGTPDQE